MPADGEAISSWLTRNAALYDVDLEDLVQNVFPTVRDADKIDFAADTTMIATLAKLSRVDQNLVSPVVISGFLPSSFGAKVVNFDDYVLGSNVLLESWRGWKGDVGEAKPWSPWVYRNKIYACPICLRESKVAIVRREWLIPISIACWKHECWLLESYIVPGVLAASEPDEHIAETPTKEVLELSRVFSAILNGKYVKTSCAHDPYAWFRKLRIIVEELIALHRITKPDSKSFQLLWSKAGQARPSYKRKPFERLERVDQRRYLMAAAVAMAHLASDAGSVAD